MASTSPSQWPAATIPHGLCVSASLFHTHTQTQNRAGWVEMWVMREGQREYGERVKREKKGSAVNGEGGQWRHHKGGEGLMKRGRATASWGKKWVEIVVSLILLPLRKGLNPHSCRWECRGHIMSSQSSPAPKRRLLSHRSWNSWRKPFHLSRFLIYTSSCCMGSMKCSNMWVFLGKPNHNSSLT